LRFVKAFTKSWITSRAKAMRWWSTSVAIPTPFVVARRGLYSPRRERATYTQRLRRMKPSSPRATESDTTQKIG
jgi:hypothetical protein